MNLRFLRPLLFAALSVFLGQQLRAQQTFAKGYDRADREYSPKDQLELPDGGYFVCGDAYVSGTQASQPYLMRLNADGDALWCREYQLFQGFHGARAIVSYGSGIYVLLIDLYGLQKTALVAVDSEGRSLVSVGYLAGSAAMEMVDLLRTSDGGFLAIGSVSRPTTGSDIAVIKLGPLGQPLWYRELAGELDFPVFGASDFGVCAIEADDGSGYYIGGSLESDAYLAKLDIRGETTFQRSYKVSGFSGFERVLTLVQTATERDFLICNIDLSNDRFPLVLEIDSAGNLLDSTAFSVSMSATDAIATSDGGFAISGSTLITPGVQGVRLAKFDSNAGLQWTNQYDTQLTFATINPPANVLQTVDGGFLTSIAALAGFEPVQRAFKVDAVGQLGCGFSALVQPTAFQVEMSSSDPTTSIVPIVALSLSAAELNRPTATSEDCSATVLD